MDADSFIYSTAVKMLKDNPFAEGQKVSNWTQVRESFVKKRRFLMERLDLDELIMFISGPKHLNFRYRVWPEYKANRAGQEAPMHLHDLKMFCVKEFGAIQSIGAEADDYVVSFKKKNPHVILSAIDKDVLKSINGKHYDFWKEEFIETTELDAIQWPFIQTLMGDGSDGIPGLRKVGIKTAQKILGDCDEPALLWLKVIAAYQDRGIEIDEAIRTMRLVRCDQFDHETHELKLFDPEQLI